MATGVSEDWQGDKSVLESNKHMLEDQLYCDVTFSFKDPETQVEEKISAHKYMLVSRNTVFCAMFEGPAKDTSDTIELVDVDKDSFMEMLRFLYYEKADITEENVFFILYCAKKYFVSALAKKCSTYLQGMMKITNVCSILEKVEIFQDKDLNEKLLTLFDESAKYVFLTDEFTEAKKSTLELTMSRDTLNASEVEVYKACVKWAEAECKRNDLEITDENKREALGDIIYLIRFPVMGLNEFLEQVNESQILSEQEALNLALMIKGSEPKRKSKFKNKKREGTWKEVFFTKGNIQSINSIYHRESEVISSFRVCSDRNILLKSIFLIIPDISSKLSICVENSPTKEFCTLKRLENRFFMNYVLYEARLSSEIAVVPGSLLYVKFEDAYDQIVLTETPLKAHRRPEVSIPSKSTTKASITMETASWHFIVGFKCRVDPSCSVPQQQCLQPQRLQPLRPSASGLTFGAASLRQ